VRVLNVNKFHYRRAGAETAYFQLARLLEEHGHEVVPFAMRHPENEPTPWDRYFPPHVEFRAPGSLAEKAARARRVLYSREARDGMARLLAAAKPDLAHLHNIAHQLSPSILEPLDAARLPIVQTLHDYKQTCPVYTHRTGGRICERCRGGRYWQCVLHRCNAGDLAMSAVNALEMAWHGWRRSYDAVDLFLCPSTFLLAKCLEHGLEAERLHFVPHFVYARDFSARAEPGASLLYAGRLAEEKGLPTLLAALAQVRGTRLAVAGDGPERTTLEALAERLGVAARVRFLGHLSGAAFERAWDEAALLVVPSEWWEVRPMVIHEAYARGRAVLAASCGTIPEIVRPGETGSLFPAGDAAALAGAIEELLGDRERLCRMGAAARRYAEETLSPARHWEALRAAYDKARQRRGSRR
jgi:glycosyltransferase involved in cell wall biosynthesis